MRRRRGPDRLTLGLAVLAAATAGTVIAGEVLRLARRRAHAEREAAEGDGILGSAEHAIATAGHAAGDTMTVAIEGYENAPLHDRVLFNMLNGFLGGFALMRLSTHGQRGGWWPFGQVRVRGRHVHHFVPGILLAFGAGAAAIVTDSRKLEQALAFPFGAGIGLTFDEAALLLDLRDVYWTREGILSVQLSLGMLAILGTTILAMRMLRRGERQVEAMGLIPPSPEGGSWLGMAPPPPATASAA